MEPPTALAHRLTTIQLTAKPIDANVPPKKDIDPDSNPRQRLVHPLHTYPVLDVQIEHKRQEKITRHDLLKLTTERCFELRNFFSPQELMKASEQLGYAGIEWEYTPDYRPFLTRDDLFDVRPFGFGNEGVWQPTGINDVIRFTRYSKDGHFAMHRDGAFVLTDEERSIFTVMAYLNEGYGAGETVFQAADGNQETVVGKTGNVLVFNHDVRHAGLPIQDGKKYILRTDIMFKRVDTDLPVAAYKDNIYYQEAMELYDKSIILQQQGDPRGSTEAYLAALEKQAQLRSIPPPIGPEVKALPRDLYAAIFKRFKLKDLLRAALVSRGWKRLARDPIVWRALYHARWPNDLALQLSVDEKDWYTAYKSHHIIERDFNVVVIDIGHDSIKFAALQDKNKPVMTVRSEMALYKGHYWGAGEGMMNMIMGQELIKEKSQVYKKTAIFAPVIVDERTKEERRYYYRRDPPDELPVVKRMSIATIWAVERGLKKNRAVTPVLFAETPGWPDKIDYGTSIQQAMWAPYYASVAAPLLVAFAHTKPNGIGYAIIYVACVLDGVYHESATKVFSQTTAEAAAFLRDPTCIMQLSMSVFVCATTDPAQETTLLQNVVITGGRAPVWASPIEASLRKRAAEKRVQVAISTEPTLDVVHGGLRLSALSNSRRLFQHCLQRRLKGLDPVLVVWHIKGYYGRDNPFLECVKKQSKIQVEEFIEWEDCAMFIDQLHNHLPNTLYAVVFYAQFQAYSKYERELAKLSTTSYRESTRSAPLLFLDMSEKPADRLQDMRFVPKGALYTYNLQVAIKWVATQLRLEAPQ